MTQTATLSFTLAFPVGCVLTPPTSTDAIPLEVARVYSSQPPPLCGSLRAVHFTQPRGVPHHLTLTLFSKELSHGTVQALQRQLGRFLSQDAGLRALGAALFAAYGNAEEAPPPSLHAGPSCTVEAFPSASVAALALREAAANPSPGFWGRLSSAAQCLGCFWKSR